MFEVSEKVKASNRRVFKGCAWVFIVAAGVLIGGVLSLFLIIFGGPEKPKDAGATSGSGVTTDARVPDAVKPSQTEEKTFPFTEKQWAKRFAEIANDRPIPTLILREKEKCNVKCASTYKLGTMAGVSVSAPASGAKLSSAMMMVSSDGSGESSAKAFIELVTLVESLDPSVDKQEVAAVLADLSSKINGESNPRATLGATKLSLAAPKGMGLWLVVEPK